MAEEKPEHELQHEYAGIAVRLDYLLFPIQRTPFLEQLSKNGFEITPPRAPPGTEFDILQRLIATKDESSLFLDTGSQQFVIRGLRMERVGSDFERLMSALESTLLQPARYKFFECHGTYRVRSKRDPLKVIDGTSSNWELCKSVGKKFGFTIGEFTHRFVLRDTEPNSIEWFELRVEPVIINPRREYFCDMIYRDRDRTKVFSIAKAMDNLVLETVAQLEQMSPQ